MASFQYVHRVPAVVPRWAPGDIARAPRGVTLTLDTLTRVPAYGPEYDFWLRRLNQTCEQYVNLYQADRAQVLTAIGLAYADAIRQLAARERVNSFWITRGLNNGIADAIYAHCMYRLGRAPGDAAAYSMPAQAKIVENRARHVQTKPAGATTMPMGLDLKSVVIGAAVGAVVMHFAMPHKKRR